MPEPRWALHGYSRLYLSLAQDHPAIWNDLELLGAYVKLLMSADIAYPGLATMPRSMPDQLIERLVDDEAIDLLPGDMYRVHGMAAERLGRQRAGSAGGRARASSSIRDTLGRFIGLADDDGAGEVLDNHARNGQDAAGEVLDGETAPTGSTSLDASLDNGAGRPAPQRYETRRDEPSLSKGLGSSSSPPARAGARAPAREGGAGEFAAPKVKPSAPVTIRCTDYQGHQLDGHQNIPGVGWRCMICEQRWASEDPLTFTDKIERAKQRSNEPPF